MIRWLVPGLLFTACAARPPTPPAAVAPAGFQWTADVELVDLTHTFDERTLYWPTSPSTFDQQTLFEGQTEAGFYYSARTYAAPEHGGTHLDAPVHFAEGMSSAEALPVERFVAPGVVVDMREAAAADADALLTVEHLDNWESAHGPIRAGSIVLVRSGWAERWPDRLRYLGDDTPGDASNLHFPGISREAAEWMVGREIGAVGIDTASIDHGPSTDFIAHQVLMAADIPAFENVALTADLPARLPLVMALPMKIGNGTGGPLRVVAVLP